MGQSTDLRASAPPADTATSGRLARVVDDGGQWCAYTIGYSDSDRNAVVDRIGAKFESDGLSPPSLIERPSLAALYDGGALWRYLVEATREGSDEPEVFDLCRFVPDRAGASFPPPDRSSNYELRDPDIDWRGTGHTEQEALVHAANLCGFEFDDFATTKYGLCADGNVFPVEFGVYDDDGLVAAGINLDFPHRNGPDCAHAGFSVFTGGKRSVGHVLLDVVSVARPPMRPPEGTGR